jgi:PAS domain-containing protein
MMWGKDINGRYIYVNNGILKGLFYNMNYRDVLGLTDLEITTKCKLLVGDENHTFGEVCGNSDLVVLKNLKKERFLEWGLINGKEVYLEVYKAPLFNNGEVIGTVGTGRDVTEWYTSIRDAVLKNKCAKKPDCFGSLVLKELDKYKFGA